MKKALNLLVLILLTTVLAKANDPEKDTLKQRPFQMSLIAPMGTNGLESGLIINQTSLNIIAGYNGGVNGVEFSGFSSILTHNMKGTQFTGFANLVNGNVSGMQFSGFLNLNGGSVNGSQFAGFLNVSGDSVSGWQTAGFANTANGNLKGWQLAGFMNLNDGKVKGYQTSGFLNVNSQDMIGGQIAGFMNLNAGNIKGLQIAGFANFSPKDVNGVQIAGFINIAKKLNGLQLGFININDTIEKGMAIGFLSFSKNGYKSFEIGGSETFWAEASFKMGSKSFYNIFSAGMQPSNNRLNYGLGYGIGTQFNASDKIPLDLDLITFGVVEENLRNNNYAYNQLNRLKISAAFSLNDHVALIAGISYNVSLSSMKNNENELIGSQILPYTITNQEVGSYRIKSYPGFNVGIRF